MAKTAKTAKTGKTAKTTKTSAELSAPDLNLVVLTGTLSKDPVQRTLPSGDQLYQYEVTSKPSVAGEPAATSPVVLFGEPRGSTGKAGDSVVVIGSVRRRFFRAAGVTQSRTEVIATRLNIAPNKRSRHAALKHANAAIAKALEERVSNGER